MAMMLIPWLVVSACCWCAFLLLRQNGRMLIRLDAIEEELTVWRLREKYALPSVPTLEASAADTEAPLVESSPRDDYFDPMAERSRINRSGLAPGAQAPDVTLPLTSGGTVSLTDYRGSQVLVVLASTNCSPCDKLVSRLNLLKASLTERSVLLVVRGSLDAVQKKMGSSLIRTAVQESWDVSRRFGTFKFPTGYLIDSRGVIAAGPLYGPEAILDLVYGLSGGHPDPSSFAEHGPVVVA